MAEQHLVRSVSISGFRYPAVALAGASGETVPTPAAAAFTDASITASGSSQIVAVANSGRRALNITNPTAVSWWLNETGGVAANAGTGCFELPAGMRWTPRPTPTNAITGIATAGTKLTVAVG